MSSAPAASPQVFPDWSQQTEEICCPLCSYNLRGLSQPLCPECGYTFVWEKLIDPTQRLHPYLFEHHPERNIWSYVQTVLGSINPIRFWGSLNPWQPSRPRRLVVFWLVGVFFAIAPLVMVGWRLADGFIRTRDVSRQQLTAQFEAHPVTSERVKRIMGSVSAYVDRIFPPPTQFEFYRQLFRSMRLPGPILICATAAILWPWATSLILLIFQQSMRRAKVRFAHVLRCTIYSDALPAIVVLTLGSGAAVLAMHLSQFGSMPPSQSFLNLLMPYLAMSLLGWGYACWRLMVAYRRYLQFQHAPAVVIATQIILFLSLGCVYAWTM